MRCGRYGAPRCYCGKTVVWVVVVVCGVVLVGGDWCGNANGMRKDMDKTWLTLWRGVTQVGGRCLRYEGGVL